MDATRYRGARSQASRFSHEEPRWLPQPWVLHTPAGLLCSTDTWSASGGQPSMLLVQIRLERDCRLIFPQTVQCHGALEHPEMGRGMELDVGGAQLLDRPPAVLGVPHVVARLNLTPLVGAKVIDADHICHMIVKVEGV